MDALFILLIGTSFPGVRDHVFILAVNTAVYFIESSNVKEGEDWSPCK